MVGLLLVSHGDMAKGMLNSATMFFGQNIENIDTLSLTLDDAVEDFAAALTEKVTVLNQGDGVLILADLFGGTPCNQSSLHMSDDVHIISGMNLPLLMEVLGLRDSGDLDFDALAETAKTGVIHVNSFNLSADDDLF